MPASVGFFAFCEAVVVAFAVGLPVEHTFEPVQKIVQKIAYSKKKQYLCGGFYIFYIICLHFGFYIRAVRGD